MFEAQTFSNFFRFPMMFLRAVHPLDQLPDLLRPLSYALPLTYGADILHGAVADTVTMPAVLNLAVLVAFCLLLFWTSCGRLGGSGSFDPEAVVRKRASERRHSSNMQITLDLRPSPSARFNITSVLPHDSNETASEKTGTVQAIFLSAVMAGRPGGSLRRCWNCLPIRIGAFRRDLGRAMRDGLHPRRTRPACFWSASSWAV